MAKLNTELIKAQAYKLGRVTNGRQFEKFMGWNSPTKAARIYNGTTTMPELDTLEEVAFKLNISLNDLIVPEKKKKWPKGGGK